IYPDGFQIRVLDHFNGAGSKAAKTRTACQGCDTRGLRPVRPRFRQCLTATYPLCRPEDIFT
ncbi:hypothetical protein, partial [Rhodovulum sulfidophilum]|uniref:hypothetical protein n=1 Tax=Rhodovulum sulfidophilum TaxID=35806 RepID=UPI001F2080A2